MHAEILTTEEHESKGVHPEFLKRIKSLTNPKVLDWGCGRGSDVLHMIKHGIDAYGAEIHQETIDRGKPLFSKLGIDHAATIKKISEDNRTDFPTGMFDLVMSYYVLEHVEDLPGALKEMRRLLKTGGIAIHLFPAHLALFEDHLNQPFVHWLPKNWLRHAAIYTLTAVGIGPKNQWPKCVGKSASERARIYYQFSISQTFYRPPRQLISAFRNAGFAPSFQASQHERIRKTPLAKLPKGPLEWLLSTFVGSVLVARAL